MNEAEWLALESVEFLQEFTSQSNRNLRLFACACCRAVSRHFQDARTLSALEVCERFADGNVELEALSIAQRLAQIVSDAHSTSLYPIARRAERLAAYSVSCALGSPPTVAAYRSLMLAEQVMVCSVDGDSSLDSKGIVLQAKRHLATLFRDIFANPFRPVAVDSAWQTATVCSLAQAAYDERQLPSGELDRVRLAVLCDALEEAGCTNADILGHLRGPGPHVRGCWVLDLILGKE